MKTCSNTIFLEQVIQKNTSWHTFLLTLNKLSVLIAIPNKRSRPWDLFCPLSSAQVVSIWHFPNKSLRISVMNSGKEPRPRKKTWQGDQGPVLRNKDVESRTSIQLCKYVNTYIYICYRLKILLQYIILILSQTQSESFENNSMQPPRLNYLSSVKGSSRFREGNFWVKKTKILWTTSHVQPSSQTEYLVGGFNPSEKY